MFLPQRVFQGAVLTVFIALAAGCHALRWPWWGERTESVPAAVSELTVSAPDGAAAPALPQYWVRNALVIDMQGVTGSGRARLAPKPGAAWPMRIAFRVRPGVFGALEVRGEQRVVIPITTEGSEVRDLELVPGVYSASTEAIEIGWGAGAQSPGG